MGLLENNGLNLGSLVLDNKNIDLSKIQTTMARLSWGYTRGSTYKCAWTNNNFNVVSSTGLVLLAGGFDFSTCKSLTHLRVNFGNITNYSETSKLDLSNCSSLRYFFGYCGPSQQNYVFLPPSKFEFIQPYGLVKVDGSLVTEVDEFYINDGSNGNYFFSTCVNGKVKKIHTNASRFDLDNINLMVGSRNILENLQQDQSSNGDYYFSKGDFVHGKLSSLNVFTNLQKICVGYDRGSNDILSDLTATNTTNLKNVPYIDLTRSGIGNFNKLQLLTNVETLILTNNIISNLTGIENLTSLQILFLDANKLEKLITTVNGKDTTTLRELYLKSNPNLSAKAESGYDNVALLKRLKAAGCTTISTDLNIN